jgi:hypothetical protein
MFIKNTLNVAGRTLSREDYGIDAARFNPVAAASPGEE